MERDTVEPVGYDDFTHIIRDASQVDAEVCRMFSLPVRKIVAGNFHDYMRENLGGSYLRTRHRFSIETFARDSRSGLRDYVLDMVVVPSGKEAQMDWEDFSDFVETAIDQAWEQVQLIHDESLFEQRYFETM